MTAIHENGYFLDSNIWIYALANNQDINKRNIACRLVDAEGVIISTQVINEVCLNLIKKSSFTEQEITQLIEAFYKGSRIISFNHDIFVNSSKNILAENPRDSSSIQNLFLPSKKSIPDVILIPHSLSPPNSRVEGGDFRDSLTPHCTEK